MSEKRTYWFGSNRRINKETKQEASDPDVYSSTIITVENHVSSMDLEGSSRRSRKDKSTHTVVDNEGAILKITNPDTGESQAYTVKSSGAAHYLVNQEGRVVSDSFHAFEIVSFKRFREARQYLLLGKEGAMKEFLLLPTKDRPRFRTFDGLYPGFRMLEQKDWTPAFHNLYVMRGEVLIDKGGQVTAINRKGKPQL